MRVSGRGKRLIVTVLFRGGRGGAAGLRGLDAFGAEFLALLAVQALGIRLLGAFERFGRMRLRRFLVGRSGVGFGGRRRGLCEGGAGDEQRGEGGGCEARGEGNGVALLLAMRRVQNVGPRC
jgi:hypothetical protein